MSYRIRLLYKSRIVLKRGTNVDNRRYMIFIVTFVFIIYVHNYSLRY